MHERSTALAGARSIATLLLLLLAVPGRPAGAPLLQPHRESPLASDGLNVYGVAEDRRSILVARGERGQWNTLIVIPNALIKGMVWTNDRLFFVNAAENALVSVATRGERTPMIVHRGPPFKDPGELTFAGNLYVADAGAQALFRLPRSVEPGTGPLFGPPVQVRVDARIGPRTFITGWNVGEILISDAESGLLAQLIDTRGEPAYRVMQRSTEGRAVSWNQAPGKAETIRRQGYPGVEAPAAIAVYNGILYVTDATSGQLFVASVYDARAIRVPTPEPGVAVTRLVAGPVAIWALDSQGHLHSLPRTIPSELTLLPGARPQSLYPVLEYLNRRRLLLTRTVPLTGSLDETLRAARMDWPARGAAREPETDLGRYASFCMLNPPQCNAGLPRPGLAQGTPIVMAELYAERFTTAIRVDLDGTRTLGAVADAALISDEFKSAASDEYLRRVNGIIDATQPVRELTAGSFRIQQEQVRYVIPVEASELRPTDSEFKRLQQRVQDTLRIAPLERVLATTAALVSTTGAAARVPAHDDTTHPDDPQCVAARLAMETVLKVVNHAAVAPKREVFVGVAEKNWDPRHVDFFDAKGRSSLFVLTDTNTVEPAAATPAASSAAGNEPVTWRAFEPTDHGTAVASLIAARTRPYDSRPGLSVANLGMFVWDGDTVTLTKKIENALNNLPMRVVNLSIENLDGAQSETQRVQMESKQGVVLFVVAAPNSASQIKLCTGSDRSFPACHGNEFENVLVVGGTLLDGKAIHPESPTGMSVHLFAPEAGYYAAGGDNGYVQVKGTSFATAIVSAAAAALSSLGDMLPGEIRQRLIATATVIDLPQRPQWARVLDVKRALQNLNQAVIVDANTGAEQAVDIVNKDEVLRFRIVNGNRPQPVRVGDIRRLRRVPGNPKMFDLAFATFKSDPVIGLHNEQLQLHLVTADGAPLPACYFADGQKTCVDLAEYKDYVGPIR
jgi:hypothetical protein